MARRPGLMEALRSALCALVLALTALAASAAAAGPPTWAMRKVDGFPRVDPEQYRLFVLAAVRRYSGTTQGLPRVRYWEAWNEPNKVPGPEFKPGAGDWYRELVNAFAQSAHTVQGNAVVAGGLAPFGISTAVAPLAFMRSLLCLSSG